jgi:23S rRNA pseudoU1915 N3-methylase RlmH
VKKIFYLIPIVVLTLSVLNMALPAIDAAEAQPAAMVSFAGFGELAADVEALGKITGKPAIAMVDGGPQGAAYAFLPVNDLKQVMGMLNNPMMGVSQKEENGVYEIKAGAQTVYATQKGQWAYAAQQKATLDSVANDPAALLGDLPKKYLLAFRVSMKNIPEPVRQAYLDRMKMMMQMTPAPVEAMKQNIEQIERISKELDDLTLGINLDRQKSNLYLDLELTAKPGTNLAAQFAAVKTGKSNFTGLRVPGAAFTANAIGTISDDDVARAKASLDALRAATQEELKNQEHNKEQLDLATEVLDGLTDVAVKTLEMKKIDYGAALILEPDAVTLSAGSVVADGTKLEDIIKKLFAEAQKAELAKINGETYKDFNLHSLSIPTPDEILVPLIGDNLDAVIGIGDKQVFLALGRNAEKTLKQAIDQSQSDTEKEISPSEFVVSALKIAKFVSAIADEDAIKATADKLAGALEQSADKDHISLVTTPIENGVRMRLSIEEGIIKALGAMAPAMPMMPVK